MDSSLPCVAFSIIFIVGTLSSGAVLYRRYVQDVSAYLVDDLRGHNLSLIAIEAPEPFDVGPFPKFEWHAGRPTSHVNGIRGEYSVYRIVTVSDSDGKTFRLWAKLEFEVFQFHRIRWRADEKQTPPEHIRGMLET